MNYEDLKKVNAAMPVVDIKGKQYVQVNSRVLGFRELYPNGSIETELLSLENGVCVMKTTIKDEEGKVLATGMAYEKESSSYINKTSFIENCETSAVGRALGMLGIGVDGSLCSAEELVNAVVNQEKGKTQKAQKADPIAITDRQLEFITKMIEDDSKKQIAVDYVKSVGKKSCRELSINEANTLIERLKYGSESN